MRNLSDKVVEFQLYVKYKTVEGRLQYVLQSKLLYSYFEKSSSYIYKKYTVILQKALSRKISPFRLGSCLYTYSIHIRYVVVGVVLI